jgi:hypothetical protein
MLHQWSVLRPAEWSLVIMLRKRIIKFDIEWRLEVSTVCCSNCCVNTLIVWTVFEQCWNTCPWKRGDMLSGSAFYLIRRMSPFCNLTTLKIIYFANFHSIIEFYIIFCGISVESKKILIQQKRIIKAMTGFNLRTPCRNLFRKLEILTLPSQFIYSTMNFYHPI